MSHSLNTNNHDRYKNYNSKDDKTFFKDIEFDTDISPEEYFGGNWYGKQIIVKKSDMKDDNIFKYLYENHEKEIWKINENETITYYTNSNGDLGSVIYLCTSTSRTMIKGYFNDEYIDKSNNFHETSYIPTDLQTFTNLVKYLFNINGEYGDRILTIENKENEYIIDFRTS